MVEKKDNIKIIYVVESLGGGVLSYLLLLCNELVNRGNEVTLLYGRRKQTPDDLESLFDSRVGLIEVNNFQRSVSISSDFKAYKEVKGIIKKINPDVVHLNSSKAGGIGRLIKLFNFHSFRNIRFFYTPHGYSFLMGNESRFKRKVYYVIEMILSRLNTTTIACGKGEYKYSKKIDKYSKYVDNCVDLEYIDSFYNEESNTQNNAFYTVGRINVQKNPDLFNKIALSHPELVFIWIGDGPLRNRLTASNIQVTGWLSNSEAMKEIQKYSNFILTSKWEGLPIALLEAMALNKNCFVTDVNGNSEVINEKNGFKFNDEKDFEQQLLKLRDNRVSKGPTARKDIERLYSKDIFMQGYTEIYKG
ncbi:MAG: glycosyltransferase [Staphylococcus epidermidis]|nr:glycosyltransferase [Staphylococcus epidermidis]